MAPAKKTPKKTPKAKRRSKPATSFKKKKLTPAHSGKVFKQNRSENKRKRQSQSRPISDSSFAACQLTSSMVSTPLSALQPRKRRRQASPGPVQLASPCPPLWPPSTVQLAAASPSSPCPPLPLPVATLQAASTSRVRKPLLLPPQGGVREASLGELFRNHHFAPLQDDITRAAASSSVCSLVQSEDSEVIVIDDDDSETGEDSAVERLGQEMLELVGEDTVQDNLDNLEAFVDTIVIDTVPATPRTLLTRGREEEVTLNLETGDDTIVIDVTGGDTTAEDVEVVAEVAGPLGAGELQEVTRRYQQQWPQLDYIPIMTPSMSPRQGKRREKNRGRGARQRGGARGVPLHLPVHLAPAHLVAGPSTFRPQNQTRINTDFSGRGAARGGVFRFGGPSRGVAERQVVARGPTMWVGEEGRGAVQGPRPIVIDGSNVAMAHGNNRAFSSKGIDMVVSHFKAIGHKKIVAFVPQFRTKGGQVKDPQVLERLAEEGVVVFTPSREVDNQRITSYDDTFILDYAAKHGGIVVTRDNFKDLANEKPEWHEVVEKRILMPTFVGEDDLMWPHDPLGRGGPSLDQFLNF